MIIDYEVPSSVLKSLYSCKGNLAPMISKFEINSELLFVDSEDLITYGFSKGQLLSIIIYMDEKLNHRQINPKLIALNKTASKLNITTEELVRKIIVQSQTEKLPVKIGNTKLEKLLDQAIAFIVHNYRVNPDGVCQLINRISLDGVPQKMEFYL